MNAPSAENKALIISICLGAVTSSPEAWRDFEHEAEKNEGFDDWALRKAGVLAKKIWERVMK